MLRAGSTVSLIRRRRTMYEMVDSGRRTSALEDQARLHISSLGDFNGLDMRESTQHPGRPAWWKSSKCNGDRGMGQSRIFSVQNSLSHCLLRVLSLHTRIATTTRTDSEVQQPRSANLQKKSQHQSWPMRYSNVAGKKTLNSVANVVRFLASVLNR